MISDYQIPEPVLFNPLKHHLGFIREFAGPDWDKQRKVSDNELIKELKHLGNSVMDVYTGKLGTGDIAGEILEFLAAEELTDREKFYSWTGKEADDYRLITLSDYSEWIVKYHNNIKRYVHIFPSRGSSHSFRVKSNTLRSALLYYIKIGKDFVTGDDLNKVRPLVGLSPVKDSADTVAIVEMIEILRNT